MIVFDGLKLICIAVLIVFALVLYLIGHCATKKDAKGKYTDCSNQQNIIDIDGASKAEAKWQKEQKPIPKFKVGDRIYDKRDSYNRNVIREVGKDYYINAFAQKMDMAYTDANFEFIEHLDNDLIDSKPAEWSEEDEMIYQHCKTILHDYGYDDWFKSLRSNSKRGAD